MVILDGLVAVDAILFCTALAGAFLSRRLRPKNTVDLRAAFELLESSIQEHLPGLQKGFTWGEAFQLLKSKNVLTNWAGLEKTLSEYEAHRYGGRPAPTSGQEEVVSLALKLGEKGGWKGN